MTNYRYSAFIITLFIIDQLSLSIENLDVVVSLDDPLGDPVKLGFWSNSITVTTSNGAAIVSFVPSMTGLYAVEVRAVDVNGAVSLPLTATIDQLLTGRIFFDGFE